MSLLIRDATVMTPAGAQPMDLLCSDGRIEIAADRGAIPVASAEEVVEGRGLLAFPGFIDPHVHTRDPGQTHKEDFAHATRAAAIGGITTILDQPNALPPVRDASVVAARVEHHTPEAQVDFGLWGIALGADNLSELGAMQQAGVVGCKLFWGFGFDRRTGALVYGAADGDHVTPPISNGEVWELLRHAAALDLLIGLHCEDRSILEAAARAAPSIVDYETLNEARPIVAETAAISLAIEVARAAGARIHILHVSSGRGIELVRAARATGVSVTAETCPHYLTLTAADYDTVGPAMKVYPPIRDAGNQDALWGAINDGTVPSVGSDHAPHSLDERSGSLAAQPAGAVGIETMVPVLIDAALRGRASIERLSWVLAEGTARLYGLFPQKGSLRPGSDADVTLVDPEAAWEIDNSKLHSKTKLSPWHSRRGRGMPVMTILRGQVIADHGDLRSPPAGRFVPAGASLASTRE
jgi:dihydroorotase